MRNGSHKTLKARPKPKKAAVEAGSGNVFADLGFKNPELMLLKTLLLEEIRSAIEERAMTQAATATLLGIDQPKVSGLLSGPVHGYSIDRLFSYLNKLGRNIRIDLSPLRNGKPATTTVAR